MHHDEDWRVTVTLGEHGHARRLMASLDRRRVERAMHERLGGRVVVSGSDENVYLYADTRAAAEEAAQAARAVLAEDQLEGDVVIHRWHPIEEAWEGPDVPLPATPAQEQAEHQRREEQETAESIESGHAEWEVRIELPDHGDAVALARRLADEGRPVVRRWRYVFVGSNDEEDANELAQRLARELGEGATVHAEPGGAMVWQSIGGSSFTVVSRGILGGLAG
jgi:hypothetical protein